MSVKEMLADDSVEAVLNLTVPRAHADVTLRSLRSGKHVYSEKPLAATRQEAQMLLDEAHRGHLWLGCAPDTFLGVGLQTARKAMDDGLVGRPVAFTSFFLHPGHEKWHENPEFYYQPGGGPMLDMGPYYMTALLNLLGPVHRLAGLCSIAIPQRTIGIGEKVGQRIDVETPDHITGVMEFKNGAVGAVMTSFATQFSQQNAQYPITIYGERGTLLVPDPNLFAGAVRVRSADEEAFRDVPPVFSHEYGRSVGLAEMAFAIREKRAARANAAQAMAVLDLMLGFEDSSRAGTAYFPSLPYEPSKPLAAAHAFGVFDG
jgi:predicted dehydrogenase